MKNSSIVGDLINFRGLVYAPVNESGVVFLFGKIADDLEIYIEEIKVGFPDCIGRRFIGKGWERISIEFEYKSSNFINHGHDIEKCDIIVCWEHDWKDCPIEVVELSTIIYDLENYPTIRPASSKKVYRNPSNHQKNNFSEARQIPRVKDLYEEIFRRVSKKDKSICEKVSQKYIGWYFSDRAFASIRIKKTSISIDCFSRGLNMLNARTLKIKPRWASFTVKSEEDVEKAVNILTESYYRIKDAIAAGETTSCNPRMYLINSQKS